MVSRALRNAMRVGQDRCSVFLAVPAAINQMSKLSRRAR